MLISKLFRRPSSVNMNRALREEINAICTAQQLEYLALSKHMRADIGLDCGCNDLPVRKRYPL